MRESRTYGSVRGARDETRVPTATTIFAAMHLVANGPPLPPWSRDGAAAFGGIAAARSARQRGSS
jgi:hypothetical protein